MVTAVFVMQLVSRVVSFHGVEIPLADGERYIAADATGTVWAYYSKPVIRSINDDVWGVERNHQLPRPAAQVDLGGMLWKDSLVDYGPSPSPSQLSS